ncbi:hypothetical protein LINPERPRIM_LOCUS35711 [Linum perenne]
MFQEVADGFRPRFPAYWANSAAIMNFGGICSKQDSEQNLPFNAANINGNNGTPPFAFFIFDSRVCSSASSFKGSASTRIIWKLRKDSHLTDEFSYEDDDVRCFCELKASRRISRTEDVKGCDFFLWCDMKIHEEVRKLTSLVGDLNVHLREVQSEKKELEFTLDRVMKHSNDVRSGSYSVPVSEAYIVHELEAIKACLSRVARTLTCVPSNAPRQFCIIL